MADGCAHLQSVVDIKTPRRKDCETCVTMGARWVHLRTCQTCGVTLCCDSSPNRHASTHARKEQHPVVSSAEEAERWLFCFVDETFAEY